MKFLKKYNYPNFNNVNYRKGARFTTNFGLDYLPNIKHFRVHYATDRGAGEIFVPYDCKVEYITKLRDSIKGFGSILRLFPEGADFEIRIMHTNNEDLSDETKAAIENNTILKAGIKLGRAGKTGFCFGRHTHTEIVSLGKDSKILEGVMKDKGIISMYDFDKEDFKWWVKKYNVRTKQDGKLALMTEKEFEAYKRRLGMKLVNNYKCIRNDYVDHKTKTWYDSRSLLSL